VKSFTLKSRKRQEWTLFTLPFNIVQEFLAIGIRQEEEIKGKQIGEKVFKTSLFADDMILYLNDQKTLSQIS
jgi:hypothetical protein